MNASTMPRTRIDEVRERLNRQAEELMQSRTREQNAFAAQLDRPTRRRRMRRRLRDAALITGFVVICLTVGGHLYNSWRWYNGAVHRDLARAQWAAMAEQPDFDPGAVYPLMRPPTAAARPGGPQTAN